MDIQRDEIGYVHLGSEWRREENWQVISEMYMEMQRTKNKQSNLEIELQSQIVGWHT